MSIDKNCECSIFIDDIKTCLDKNIINIYDAGSLFKVVLKLIKSNNECNKNNYKCCYLNMDKFLLTTENKIYEFYNSYIVQNDFSKETNDFVILLNDILKILGKKQLPIQSSSFVFKSKSMKK